MKRFVLLGVCVMMLMLMGSVMIGTDLFGGAMMAITEPEVPEYESVERASVHFDVPSDRNWAGPVLADETSGSNTK
jgi:hypothetical protein